MSLEKTLEALGEKIDRNSDLLEKVLSTGKGGSVESETPRSRRRAAADDGADAAPARSRRRGADEGEGDEAPSRRSRRGAAEDDDSSGRKGKGEEEAPPRRRRGAAEEEAPATGRKGKKPAKLKIADVRAAFASFLDVKDKKEEEDRRAFIEEVLDFLKVDKTTDIEEADFQGAIDVVDAYDKAKDPNDVDIADYFG